VPMGSPVSMRMGVAAGARTGTATEQLEDGENYLEDAQSSEVSSVIDHESLEDTLRVDSVALSAPVQIVDQVEEERRQSTSLTFGEMDDQVVSGSAPPHPYSNSNRDTAITSSSQEAPGSIGDLLDTSYITTALKMYHLSGFSELPVSSPFPVNDDSSPHSA